MWISKNPYCELPAAKRRRAHKGRAVERASEHLIAFLKSWVGAAVGGWSGVALPSHSKSNLLSDIITWHGFRTELMS